MHNIDPTAIPASACNLRAEIAHLGNNGEEAKTAPIRLLARSSKPIEHWYWGNVVHDLQGYNLNGKSRLPIDFDHDTGEAIGYLNKFEVEDDGLYASGAIVSTQEGDRASKIMAQMRAGIPYEASINFGGDGIEIERVPDNKTAKVNGYEFSGGQVVRKWPLRGVAVTLYGADSNTSSALLSQGGKTFAAKYITQEEDGDMSTPEELSAEADKAVEAVEAAETVANPEELSQTVEVVEAEAVEAVEAEAAEVDPAEDDYQFSAKDFANLVTEFGAEVAAQTVTNGGGYVDALRLAYEARGERIAELEARVTELSAKSRTVSTAVSFADGETSKTKKVSLAAALQQKFHEVK